MYTVMKICDMLRRLIHLRKLLHFEDANENDFHERIIYKYHRGPRTF